jgi:hypothetical protein
MRLHSRCLPAILTGVSVSTLSPVQSTLDDTAIAIYPFVFSSEPGTVVCHAHDVNLMMLSLRLLLVILQRFSDGVSEQNFGIFLGLSGLIT